MAKILTFSKKQPFHEFLDELREMYDKDLATNFVCIYDRDYDETDLDEAKLLEKFKGKNETYWYGTSCTQCLGLLVIMKEVILDYIREQNEGAGG